MRDSNWEELYLQTVLEVNAQKMPARIAATRSAIAERLRDLEPAIANLRERQKIDKALNALQVLETETRSWESSGKVLIDDYSKETWVETYQNALLELEHAKLRGRIGDARVRIRSRIEKLKDIPGLHSAEYRASSMSRAEELDRRHKMATEASEEAKHHAVWCPVCSQ